MVMMDLSDRIDREGSSIRFDRSLARIDFESIGRNDTIRYDTNKTIRFANTNKRGRGIQI